jgi:hypothetical protein
LKISKQKGRKRRIVPATAITLTNRRRLQDIRKRCFQFQDSVSWNCLYPLQTLEILGTTFTVSIPKPSDAGTTIIRTSRRQDE